MLKRTGQRGVSGCGRKYVSESVCVSECVGQDQYTEKQRVKVWAFRMMSVNYDQPLSEVVASVAKDTS